MRNLVRVIGLTTLIMLGTAGTARSETYKVGPGAKYSSLRDIAGKLSPGDIVELRGDATYPSALFTKHGQRNKPITIQGTTVNGRRPIITGGRDTIEAAGDHYIFDNIEITGGEFRCFFHRADNITLRNVIIHDCPAHGVLGADDGSGSMLMERCEIYRCGDGDKRHPVYMATDERTHPGSVFRMQYCYVHDGKGGNNVKSRAERNEIYFNWIEGARYHELELIGPDGADPSLKREDSEVIGNVFRKLNDVYTVRIGGDGTGETNGRYRFVNNTFLVQKDNRAVFRLFDGIESVEMHNNAIYAIGGGPATVVRTSDAKWSTKREIIGGTNNWIPKGSQSVPSGWTATIFGTDPLFENLDNLDLRPRMDSPLKDAGAPLTSLASPPGFAFPSPKTNIEFQPHLTPTGLSVTVRGSDGQPDIGALEGGFEYVDINPNETTTPPQAVRMTNTSSLGPSRPSAGGGRCGCDIAGENCSAQWGLAIAISASVIARRRPRKQPSRSTAMR